MSNVINYGEITGGTTETGGLIGQIYSGSTVTLNQVVNYGKVVGVSNYLGGIIGSIQGNEITLDQVANFGDITGSRSGVGGIAGGSDANAKITLNNAFNLGKISGGSNSNNVGGIIGFISNSIVTMSAVYSAGNVTTEKSSAPIGLLFGFFGNADTQLSTGPAILVSLDDLNLDDGFYTSNTIPYNSASTKKTLAEMKNITTYSSTWDIYTDGSKIWRINDGDTLPWLSFMGETPPTQVVIPTPTP